MRSVEPVKPLYYQYWGKTAEGGGYHLLPYHCLDVAAVGEVFLRNNTQVRQRLALALVISRRWIRGGSLYELVTGHCGRSMVTSREGKG
jgi:CRISPR-associated endonuclease/helicase Cas3